MVSVIYIANEHLLLLNHVVHLSLNSLLRCHPNLQLQLRSLVHFSFDRRCNHSAWLPADFVGISCELELEALH